MAKKRRRGRSVDQVLTEEEEQALLNTCHDLIDEVIINLALVMGMRADEIAHLHKSWIKGDEIAIPAEQPCNCGTCQRTRKGRWTPKRPMSIRSLPMPPFIQKLLADFFHANSKLDRSRQAIYSRIKSRLIKIGKVDAYPHALRATCATNLAAKGFETAALCYFMGWADLSYAQYYIRIARARAEAKRQIDRIYGKSEREEKSSNV